MKIKYVIPLITGLLISCGGNSSPTKFDVSLMVSNANLYIKQNIDSVVDDYKGKFHLNSPIGWLNDPNGFSEFNDKYHLFYQYNPYDSVWGPMHWGHQTTKDFVKWDLEDVALAPDENYDQNGCFSGTALVDDNKLYLAYTSVDVDWNQDQSLAYSEDGVTFKKLGNNPIIGLNKLPENFSHPNFRDPKIFSRDGKYYIIAGNENTLTKEKQLIMYSSTYLEGEWEYCGVIYSRTDVGGILECPDLFKIGNNDILVCSPQSIKSDKFYEFQNTDSCVYLIGNLSTNTNKYYKYGSLDFIEFDKGFSFYAPQILETSDGRKVLTAWMKSWAELNVTQADGWAGSMVFPRELTLENNHIYQKPVRELQNYYSNSYFEDKLTLTNQTSDLNSIEDNCCSIEFTIDLTNSQNNTKAGIEVFKNEQYFTKIYYDSELGCVIFDRNNCGSILDGIRYSKIELNDNKLELQLLLDISSCEVFIEGGYYTQSGNIFPPLDCNDISFFVENGTADFINIQYNHIDI